MSRNYLKVLSIRDFLIIVSTCPRILVRAHLHRSLDPFYIARRGLYEAISRLSNYASGILLDVGCGSSPYKHLFLKFVNTYVSVDLNVSRDNEADTRALVRAEGTFLPFRSGCIDTVLCTEVLEHVPEPLELLKEIRRVIMKQGGHIILSAPQVWGLHSIPHDYFRFTPFGLQYLLDKSSFRVVSTRQTTGIFGTIGQRLSSFFYHQYGQSPVSKPIVLVLCMILQRLFLLLDAAHRRIGDTLDNVVLAEAK